MRAARLSSLAISAFGPAWVAGCGDDSPPPVADGGNVGGTGRGGTAIGHSGGEAPGGEAAGGVEQQGGSAAGAELGGSSEVVGGAAQGEGGAPFSVCNDGKGATISGRVLAPNGELPLPGVSVYVPSGSVDPLPYGASCWLCDGALRGEPVAVATTDLEGKFE